MQKLEDFTFWFLPIIDKFPKKEKWALCTQIKNSIYQLMRCAVKIQKSRDKTEHMLEFDIDLEVLKYLVRQAHTNGHINNRKLMLTTEKLVEIGKILGGLMKWQKGVRL